MAWRRWRSRKKNPPAASSDCGQDDVEITPGISGREGWAELDWTPVDLPVSGIEATVFFPFSWTWSKQRSKKSQISCGLVRTCYSMRQQQTQIDLGIHGITLGNWCRAVFEHAHRAACPTSQESHGIPKLSRGRPILPAQADPTWANQYQPTDHNRSKNQWINVNYIIFITVVIYYFDTKILGVPKIWLPRTRYPSHA